jgi:hypothetical protein
MAILYGRAGRSTAQNGGSGLQDATARGAGLASGHRRHTDWGTAARGPSSHSSSPHSRSCREALQGPGMAVVGRGHVSILTNLDTWPSKLVRDIGYLRIFLVSQMFKYIYRGPTETGNGGTECRCGNLKCTGLTHNFPVDPVDLTENPY